MAVTGERRQVSSTYYFVVEIANQRSSYFRSVGGLKSEAEVVPMQEGGRNETELRLIGRTKYPNLVLKQGFAGPELYTKREGFRLGSGARFNGAIIQMGPGSAEVCRWEFTKAWICKWEGPEFDASKNEISVETIEIAHEGLSMSGGGGGGGGGGSSAAASAAAAAKAAAAAAAKGGASARKSAANAAKNAAKNAGVTLKGAGAAAAGAAVAGAAAAGAAGAAAGAAGAAGSALKGAAGNTKGGIDLVKSAETIAKGGKIDIPVGNGKGPLSGDIMLGSVPPE